MAQKSIRQSIVFISFIIQMHMHADTLTCGDRALVGWVKSVEWVADRRPCALLTVWWGKGADSTSCWRKATNRHKCQNRKHHHQSGDDQNEPPTKTSTVVISSALLWATMRFWRSRYESGFIFCSFKCGGGYFLFVANIQIHGEMRRLRVQETWCETLCCTYCMHIDCMCVRKSLLL